MIKNYGRGISWNLQTIAEYSNPDHECKIWIGGKHQQGYAMMRYQGEMRTVHSVISELKYGHRTDKYHGERVTRTCKNKLCVNPDHIVIENSSDIKRRPYHCVNRKLTQEQARDVKLRLETGERGLAKKLAEEYNVKKHIIDSVKYNRSYKELPK